MRFLFLGLALLLSAPLAAQDEPVKKKPAAKKPAAPKKAVQAHKKPTPEQVRRFKELEKKKQQ